MIPRVNQCQSNAYTRSRFYTLTYFNDHFWHLQFFFHVFCLCFTAFSWHSPSWWHRRSTGMCMWSMSVITLKWTNVNTFASSPLLKIMKFVRSLQLWWVQRTSEIHTATDKFLGKLFCVLLSSWRETLMSHWSRETLIENMVLVRSQWSLSCFCEWCRPHVRVVWDTIC